MLLNQALVQWPDAVGERAPIAGDTATQAARHDCDQRQESSDGKHPAGRPRTLVHDHLCYRPSLRCHSVRNARTCGAAFGWLNALATGAYLRRAASRPTKGGARPAAPPRFPGWSPEAGAALMLGLFAPRWPAGFLRVSAMIESTAAVRLRPPTLGRPLAAARRARRLTTGTRP